MKEIPAILVLFIVTVIILTSPAMQFGTMMQITQDNEQVRYIATSLIDDVRDTRSLTQERLDEANLELAALDGTYDLEVTRENRVENPAVDGSGETSVSYIPNESAISMDYDSGDRIIVTIKTISTPLRTMNKESVYPDATYVATVR